MDGLVEEALKRKRKGDYARAIALFEEAIETQGETPFLLSHLGHCFFLAGDLVQARHLLEESIRRDPRNSFAMSFLARVAEKEGNAKEQIELLSEAVSISGDDVHARVALLWALVKAGKAKKAVAHAEWLVGKASENQAALKAAAVAFRRAGQNDDANGALKKMLALDPNEGFALKELLDLSGDRDAEKLSEIERLLKLPANRMNRELMCMRVKLLEGAGDIARAVDAAKEAAESFPDDRRVKMALALIFARAGRPRDSLPLLSDLIRADPGDFYLHNSFAGAAEKGRFLEDAYAFYTELIRESPLDKKLFGWRRRIQRMLEEGDSGGGEEHPSSLRSSPSTPRCSQDLSAALKRHFGYDSFRPGQEEVIRAIVGGSHSLAVMPTGRGKSLCFQLPALLRDGLAIVVSPLIALMKDQVDDLSRRGIAAAALNSSLSLEAQDEVIARAADGKLRFLYVAPERFKVASFAEVLPRLNPSLFVVDEAHCISQWGHDFRPDYLKIGRAIASCGAKQIVAMTATATPDVQRDIVKQLGVAGMHTYVAGFERKNLSFAVTDISGDDERAARLIELVRGGGGSAIVYCSARKGAETAADILKSRDIKAEAYHAGMEHEERIRVQDAFMSGEIQAIAATNAFGMGIDKADIRLVVHYNMPGSIEAYYQEAGRAGRDGKAARCELLFTFADKHVQEFFIDGSNPSPQMIRSVYRTLLEEKRDVVELSARAIAGRSGEGSDMAAASALSILERMDVIERRGAGEAMGRIEITESFFMKPPPERATIRSKLWSWIKVESGGGNRKAFDVLPETIVKELALDDDQVFRGLRNLADEGLIAWQPPFRGRAVVIRRRMDSAKLPIDEEALDEKRRRDEAKLKAMIKYATSKGCRQAHIVRYFGGAASECGVCDVCRGEARPKIKVDAAAKVRPKPNAADETQGELFEKLRAWRLERSRLDGVPAFVILPDRALRSVCSMMPVDAPSLIDCFGIGRAKAEKYGDEILRIVREFKGVKPIVRGSRA